MEILTMGSIAFILMGIILAVISLHQQAWCDYGRETGLLIAVFLVTSGFLRILDTHIYEFDSRKWNSLIGVAFTAILLNLVALHAARHWYLKHPRQIEVNHARNN